MLGVDDFALRRRHRYATILIDAETGTRIDVPPGRGAEVLEVWLRAHPGVEIVCRDGSLTYGVGLLECARRLDVSLNTIKRYARRSEPEEVRRAPRYRQTLVDPYRDHLRARRAEDPAVPVMRLFHEIKELGYTGSLNLLYRYLTQGRAEGDRPVITARRLTRLLLTGPDRLRDTDTDLLRDLTAACPEPAAFARLIPRLR